jgi:hypothetical protein
MPIGERERILPFVRRDDGPGAPSPVQHVSMRVGPARHLRASARTSPSGPINCTTSGICPTAWVEHERHGS